LSKQLGENELIREVKTKSSRGQTSISPQYYKKPLRSPKEIEKLPLLSFRQDGSWEAGQELIFVQGGLDPILASVRPYIEDRYFRELVALGETTKRYTIRKLADGSFTTTVYNREKHSGDVKRLGKQLKKILASDDVTVVEGERATVKDFAAHMAEDIEAPPVPPVSGQTSARQGQPYRAFDEDRNTKLDKIDDLVAELAGDIPENSEPALNILQDTHMLDGDMAMASPSPKF
jgi:hypothetical protein